MSGPVGEELTLDDHMRAYWLRVYRLHRPDGQTWCPLCEVERCAPGTESGIILTAVGEVRP